MRNDFGILAISNPELTKHPRRLPHCVAFIPQSLPVIIALCTVSSPVEAPGFFMQFVCSILIAASCLAATSSGAHHSFAAEFLGDQTRTIEGTVTEVWFRNPHVRYYIDVADANGETISWDVRTSSPTILVRRGWNETTIREGDKVRVEGYLGRDGRKLLSLISIELPDGTVLGHSY